MSDVTEGRHALPIPDRPRAGLITYDAKDPDTSFPPIEPLRPLAGGSRPPDHPEERLRIAMARQ